MPQAAQRMVMVSMFAGRRRELVAGSWCRIGARGRRKAQRVLAEGSPTVGIAGDEGRRHRPGKPQGERQHAEDDAQPGGRAAMLSRHRPDDSSARHIRPSLAGLTSRIPRIISSAGRGKVTTTSILRRRGNAVSRNHTAPPPQSPAFERLPGGEGRYPDRDVARPLQQRQRQGHLRGQPEGRAK